MEKIWKVKQKVVSLVMLRSIIQKKINLSKIKKKTSYKINNI